MIELVKETIKKTKVFQNRRANQYFESMHNRLDLLPADQKTNGKKIIYFKEKKTKQIDILFRKISITLRYEAAIQSWIDTSIYFTNLKPLISNTSPDYSVIIHNSIETLKNENYPFHDNQVKESNFQLLCSVEIYIDRVIEKFDEMVGNCPKDYVESFTKCREFYKRMKNKSAETTLEALQRIAFWSDMFWQTGHNLMGFGRLDYILKDIPNDESIEEITNCFCEFFKAMHRYYYYKSSLEAIGDTGQIIVLGGKNEKGEYFYNQYTKCIMMSLKKVLLPDPKLLLRVSKNMPQEVLDLAVDLIAMGTGSPLLANDDIIIPALIEFGYDIEDANNYVTSACWEPLAYGKSAEVNNIRSINYADAMVKTYLNEGFEKCVSFDELLNLYKQSLIKQLDSLIVFMDSILWEDDPLLTLFTPGCINNGCKISDGGADYNSFGLLGDGIGNTVNSLLLIKHYVFGSQQFLLTQIKNACINNYKGFEELKTQFSMICDYYGTSSDEVIELTEYLKDIVKHRLETYKNRYDGGVKWGISSSNYMRNGRKTNATPDGRLSGEALNVHISGKSVPYTELFQFASKLNYKGCYSNGNVVDYYISPDFIKQNQKKFVRFIHSTIKNGFFEQQMNVVSSKTLVDAMSHPEKYPYLIVRVWGFSAYFNDLPDDYKKIVIDRAINSEKALLQLGR